MKSILFVGKNYRRRVRDTIAHLPSGFKAKTQMPLEQMNPDHTLSNEKESRSKLKLFLDFLAYGNFPKMANQADILYSPGKLILSNHSYILELDNVAVIAYYNLNILGLGKWFFKKQLESKKCKKIVCISYATKKSLSHFFHSKKIDEKAVVVYPFMQEQNNSLSMSKKINLLFISTSFYLKAGKEVLDAFEKANRNDLHLTVITKLKDLHEEDRKRLENNPSITLLEANLPREVIKEKYYSKSDVFIMPTYQDSFGLVYLEALSFGMAIISSKTYNMPEFIEGNGYLIEPPFHYFHKRNFLPNKKMWQRDIPQYCKDHEFPKVTDELVSILKSLNKKDVLAMKMKSRELFEKKFSPKVRMKSMREVLTCVE